MLQLGYLAAAGALQRMSGAAVPFPYVTRLALNASVSGMIFLHVAHALVPPPPHLPDLFSVGFAAYSCVHFVAAYLIVLVYQWRAASTAPPHTPFDAPSARPILVEQDGGHEKTQ